MRKQDKNEIRTIIVTYYKLLTGKHELSEREQLLIGIMEEKLYKLMCDIETRERKETYASE